MEVSIEFWFLLPFSIAIAIIALSSGTGSAIFFTPLFIIGLGLEPKIAIGTALIAELFDFSSRLFSSWKSKLIDFRLGLNLLLYSIPFAILGTLYAGIISPIILKTIFSVSIIFIGYQLFTSWRTLEKEKINFAHQKEFEVNYERSIKNSEGNVYNYSLCNKNMGRMFAAIGGTFLGMISTGLAELQEHLLATKCKVPIHVAGATTTFVVVITVLIASVGHIFEFAQEGTDVLNQVVNLIMFTIPGVIIGGQIGPRLQKNIPTDILKLSISILFVLTGAFMLYFKI